ncbi:hypothetical protein [Allofranklinella schreckenbergeri]|nr:hypothetical protein [Allofranklinella schreckenbergeri]
MPAKAGIQRQPCAREGMGQRQRRPVSAARPRRPCPRRHWTPACAGVTKN